MFVDKLQVINDCLATLGETPLNTLEDDHSFKAAAISKLDTANRKVQHKGFWFNTENIELLPDATSKYIYVPLDVIKIRSLQYRGLAFAQRGRRLYNTAHNTYEFSAPVCVQIVRLLDFDELPHHASAAIGDEAVLRFQHEFDGDQTRYRCLYDVARESRAELNAEELRQRKPNLLNTPNMRAVVGLIENHTIASELPHPLR